MPNVEVPNLFAAFRTTTSGDGSYMMTFKFPSMQAMHDADDEWRALRKAVETQPEASRSPVGEGRLPREARPILENDRSPVAAPLRVAGSRPRKPYTVPAGVSAALHEALMASTEPVDTTTHAPSVKEMARAIADGYSGGNEQYGDATIEQRTRYHEAALAVCSALSNTQPQAPSEEASELRTALTDPNIVHLNMLRGGIAKPSHAQIWHIYGEALAKDMPAAIRQLSSSPDAV